MFKQKKKRKKPVKPNYESSATEIFQTIGSISFNLKIEVSTRRTGNALSIILHTPSGLELPAATIYDSGKCDIYAGALQTANLLSS